MASKMVVFEDLSSALCALGFVEKFREDSIVFDRNGVIIALPMYRADEEVEERHLFYVRRTLANVGLSMNLPKGEAVVHSRDIADASLATGQTMTA
jgi:hypothetical protein